MLNDHARSMQRGVIGEFYQGEVMQKPGIQLRARWIDHADFARKTRVLAGVGVLAAVLGACTTFGTQPAPMAEREPPPPPEVPSTIRAAELVGRWGLASYTNPNDRARTEAAAKNQCRNPYLIGEGANGGVVMHLADEATPQELRLKGSVSGKNYIGPEGPAGGDKDREILSFDGRTLTTRFIDKDAASRYGTMIYVRCAPRP
ncbi:MAG TPA: hypothetical protein VNZ94_13430 [Xanthobacteraceae bacterium]|nr:hypothetical protein [Xanthobacteraceae bacterium]